ncbi:MAG TPA: hypothetical protein VGQ82_00510 [Chthoniobacterales bacterium]|nr:hypothetical protein [Chthoniobacterales bacterium]
MPWECQVLRDRVSYIELPVAVKGWMDLFDFGNHATLVANL